MKKWLITLTALFLALTIGAAQAATYTLPEKMYNQLVIGSGLKGTFIVTSEGEKFDTPFMKAITDAEFSIRGIRSGQDLHYYIFQQKDQEQQSAVSELYRRDGICYFRSDMVKDRILALPTLGEFLDAAFPAQGENTPASPFITRILSLSENEKETKWEPVLKRYQNGLELWLADFTVQAESVRMDNGLSALDFTYEIPMDRVRERILQLFAELAADSEVAELLEPVMTDEEKQIYLNGNLLYFYEEALNTLTIDKPVRMSKRVSAMGEVLRFRLEMPTDIRTTGYEYITIENTEQMTAYTLKKPDEIIVIAVPSPDIFQQTAYDQTLWFARVSSAEADKENNLSVRVGISRNSETYSDDEDRSHEKDRFLIRITPDTSCLPEDTDLTFLPEREEINIDLNLHFYSKYAQNSATTLEIDADVTEGGSTMKISGRLKTSSPWLFMPFEVTDPVAAGTNPKQVLIPYFVDWISNASYMITHTQEEPVEIPLETSEPEAETESEKENVPEDGETPAGNDQNGDAETAPLEVSEEVTEQE